MEASNENKIYETYERTQSFINTWIGVFVTVIAIIVIFIVASLEGTREIRASNSLSGRLMNEWRDVTGESFPENRVGFIEFEGREYYFVVEEFGEENEILSWYWAYDGGLGYIFQDFKYYVLAGITFIFSIFVALINYNSTMEKAVETTSFKKTLSFYKKNKDVVAKDTHLLPYFCAYKNEQKYTEAKRNIVESANITWEKYNRRDFGNCFLLRWQKRRLNKIKKIKIKQISPNDLLYENRFSGNTIRILPESQEEHRKKFLMRGSVTKFFTSFLSGLVAGFGIIIGNWALGLLFATTILLSGVSAIISAADYVSNKLKNRFIGKGELLNEFNNIKQRFYEQLQEEEYKNIKHLPSTITESEVI